MSWGACYRGFAQTLDARGQKDLSADQLAAQPIVEGTDLRDPGIGLAFGMPGVIAVSHHNVSFDLGGGKGKEGRRVLQEADELALNVAVARDVALGGAQGAMASEFLHVA